MELVKWIFLVLITIICPLPLLSLNSAWFTRLKMRESCLYFLFFLRYSHMGIKTMKKGNENLSHSLKKDKATK